MNDSDTFSVGQRWISEAEPELGLGLVTEIQDRRVTVAFSSVDTVRCYAAHAAPLRRVRFRTGDRVATSEGRSLTVTAVSESGGCLTYHCHGEAVAESKLSSRIGFNAPLERLMTGRIDPVGLFDLRCRALFCRSRWRRSPVRGFSGGRIGLVPHQFYIASEVAARRVPRVLLCDETGLGKTIEACLILHRLVVTGRVGRVLVLVPEPLVHQWFVELLRRFNLLFRICDQALCRSLAESDPGVNPFTQDQLILTSLEFAAGTLQRSEQITTAGWDLVIVDEAHHLQTASAAYDLVAALAADTPGLFLLTATPEQLGQSSHFARLRLLDPHRYRDIETFRSQATDYHRIAALAARILDGRSLKSSDRDRLLAALEGDRSKPSPSDLDRLLAEPTSRQRILEDLMDRNGMGRVIFRNTRRTVGGFPRRMAHLTPLDCSDATFLQNLAKTFDAESGGNAPSMPADFSHDPRLDWLAAFLRQHPEEKILLICRSPAKAGAVEEALARRINVKSALFHEDLSLIHRDRNAAWFADPGGARILICSEIGSEGRNFQFARHLVLLDLPLDPEQLEQRVGRLDRIGRTETVHIHVPYLEGSVQEVLARWFDQGLDAFEKVLPGGRQILAKFGTRVRTLALAPRKDQSQLAELIRESAAFRKDLGRRLTRGRDRLLELGSFRPDPAEKVLDQVRDGDDDESLKEFMAAIFDHFGIEAEAVSPRVTRLRPGLDFDEAFQGFRGDEMAVTFDRAAALERQDLTFLTWDHPMVTEAMELLLGSERGNCALAWWPEGDAPELLLETVHVLECVAPPTLHIDRFLPPTPIRTMVDRHHRDRTGDTPWPPTGKTLFDAPASLLHALSDLLPPLVPKLLEKSRELAKAQVSGLLAQSRSAMADQLEREIDRLRALARVNPHVRPREIALAEAEKEALGQEIDRSRLRLDTLRLVWKGPLPDRQPP